MRQEFFNLELKTNGQKLYEFTDQTIDWINKNNFNNGILNLSIQHTSASLIVQENADPDVLKDMMKFLYTQGKGAPKGSGARKGAASGLRSFRKLQKYDKNLRKQGSAILERKGKNIKLNSKGGIQNVANKLKKASKAHAAQAVTLEKIAKKSTGGMADYYKDIL